MKAKKGWIRFNSDYQAWDFSPTKPEFIYEWTEIIYFEVETND